MTDEQIKDIASKNGLSLGLYQRGSWVNNGEGKIVRKKSDALTPFGENIIAFAKAVIAAGKKECNCDLLTKLVGDGCEVCNPALALEHARETILEREQTISDLIVALDEMLATAYEEDWGMRPSCSACLSAAENVLAVARGEK